MVKKIIPFLKKHYIKYNNEKQAKRQNEIRKKFMANGQIPWSEGYSNHKQEAILNSISDATILREFSQNRIPKNHGYRLDERIVEYPWIISNLKKEKSIFLDAGSTFNYEYLLDNEIIKSKEKYIYTFYPEPNIYNQKRISYIYGDLRELPFKNDFFEEIVCQSTIEHIDMDNSMYGYDLESTVITPSNKSYEYLKVINELVRVLKKEGKLLLTFPYGKFENHGFFQQFDKEMVQQIITAMEEFGNYELQFFKYLPDGWIAAIQEDCDESESFNPHTQIGKKNDFAAHSRAICCLKFNKK